MMEYKLTNVLNYLEILFFFFFKEVQGREAREMPLFSFRAEGRGQGTVF